MCSGLPWVTRPTEQYNNKERNLPHLQVSDQAPGCPPQTQGQ